MAEQNDRDATHHVGTFKDRFAVFRLKRPGGQFIHEASFYEMDLARDYAKWRNGVQPAREVGELPVDEPAPPQTYADPIGRHPDVDYSRFSDNQLAVYDAMRRLAEDGICQAGLTAIARESGVPLGSIHGCLAKLNSVGLTMLARSGNGGMRSIYQVANGRLLNQGHGAPT